MTIKGSSNSGRNYKQWERAAAQQTVLIHRAEQAIELLMECNGHTELTKSQFAAAMAPRYGSAWLANGKPNRRLVEDVCNLTKDQNLPGNETVAHRLGGYIVAYAPNIGGMTLIDSTGEMTLNHMLHLLAGDIMRQKTTITVNRRRREVWKAVARNAVDSGDIDLGLLCSQMQNEIDRTGFVSEDLASEFLVAVGKRGIE